MVTLINKFTVNGDIEQFQKAVAGVSEFMRAQPGYLGHEMFQSLNKPEIFVEMARWDEAASHRKAVQSDEFRERVQALRGLATPDADLYAPLEDHS